MFAATTSPSYSPTWVSGQMPVTSPIAHSRSPARRYSSTADPARVGLDADRLQADPCHARAAPGRHQQPVAALLAAVPELQDVVLAVAARGGGVHPEHQLDAVPAQGLAERLAQRRGLAGEQAVGALDEHRLAAEAPHDLRELDARRPAAQHEQAARDGLHAGRLAGAPDARRAPAAREAGARSGRRRSPRRRARRCAGPRRPRRRRCRPACRCRAAGRCRGRPASAPARRRSSSTP